MGKGEYSLLLLLGGITGYLSSAVFRPTDFAVGASTSLFAVLGALCFEFWVTYRSSASPLKQQFNVIFILMMTMALFSGLIPFQSNIDAWGHLGGFIFGLAYIMAFFPKALDQQAKVSARMRAIGKITILILVVGLSTLLVLAKVPGCEKSPNQCERMCKLL